MDTEAIRRLRSRFPALARGAYLNAGSAGPLSWETSDALGEAMTRATVIGRGLPYFMASDEERARLRDLYARAIGADADDVALTSSTSDGLARALGALDLRAGDEVVTSSHEHPALLGPLGALARHGVDVRVVDLADVADAVQPSTRAVACSHVSWLTGEHAPVDALREVGQSIPVIYDGAQGAGALAVNPASLGCAAYAGSGQKWLCGPVGLGMLWISPAWGTVLAPVAPAYSNLSAPADGVQAAVWEDARRFDAPALNTELVTAGAAGVAQLQAAGWEALWLHSHALASGLALELTQRGYDVAGRDDGPLVTWVVDDPARTRDQLASRDVIVRDLPGTPWIRASVGGFNDEADIARLLDALAAVA